jgi:hypothetical protein
MVITARFASVCPRCNARIAVGSQVEWNKGSPAKHVSCRSEPQPAVAVAVAPYMRTVKWEPCKRASLHSAIGEVLVVGAGRWASLRTGAEAEPLREGEAVVVAGQEARYESQEDNEDMGDMSGAGWIVTLFLRRATAEEAAPALAAAAQKQAAREAAQARSTQIRELQRLCREGLLACDEDARRPVGREHVISLGVHGSGYEVAILSEDGEGVAIWNGGYYDDYRPTLAVSRDPRAAELARALIGVAS